MPRRASDEENALLEKGGRARSYLSDEEVARLKELRAQRGEDSPEDDD